MKNGVDQGVCISYRRLSYRRKFIRTLWLSAVIFPILFALRVDGFVIGALFVLAVGQACYAYYHWQREIANSEDDAVASQAGLPPDESVVEAGQISSTAEVSPRRQWAWLAGAFALCFVAGGAICWRGSYEDYLNAGISWGILLMLAGAALFLSWGVGAGVVASAITLGSVLPAVIFGRVVLDCMKDPTDHNLWPFEVVIAFGMGMITAFPFAALGTLLRRLTHRSEA